LASAVSIFITVSAWALAASGFFAHQLEHALPRAPGTSAKLDRFRIFLEIVVAVGQAEAALIELRDHLGGVLEILSGAEIEQMRPRRRVAGARSRSAICALSFRLRMRSSSGWSGEPRASMAFSSMQAA
jgi:hypothetical protein